MMRPETALICRSVLALHAPSPPSASTNPVYPMSSLVRSFIASLRPLVVDRVVGAHRDDLHRRVAHIAQEPIDDRSVQRKIPARSRRLTEDDVRDALALRELDQRVGDARTFQLDDLCAE